MLHLLLPLVSARGQAADGSMGPDLSTPNSRRPALDYRPEVGGVAMSRPSTLPPPPDRGGPPPLPATGSPEPGKAWKSFAVGRQRVHQSSRLTGGSRETRVARGPKASGAFEGLGLGRRRRRQRGAKRRDVPVSALARIPLAKARMTANQPAAAATLAAIRNQVSSPTTSLSPSRSLILSPCFCPRPTLTRRATQAKWQRVFVHNSSDRRKHVTAPASLANTSRSNCYIVSLLGTRASDFTDAQRMAQTLQHFGDGGRHPLILFHEASAPRATLGAIRLALSSHRRQLRPALVDFPRGPPAGSGLDSRTAGLKTTNNRKGWGYYHMINFFAFDIFRHPALRDAEYVMRIDCDGTLHAPMPDLFTLARLRGAAYVTPVGSADCGAIVEGLPGLAYAAAKRHGLEARVLPLMFRNRCKRCPTKGQMCVIGFYNNLEVVRVADFVALPPAAATFARAVQRSHGIYRHRWGDAIIRRLELALMGSKVLHLDELAPHSKYCHRDYCMPENTHTLPSGKVRHFLLAAVG